MKNFGCIESFQKHHYTEKYREDVIKIVTNLIKENKLPKVVVAATDLFRIPRPDNDINKSASGARMETMEKRMEGLDMNMTELLKKDTLLRTDLEAKINALDNKLKEMDKGMTDFIR